MDQRQTHLEDLPIELFRLIFEYLAPHDLLHAFKKLNRRFESIIIQQPLSLPNNRSMNVNLYNDYLTKIIPEHASQIFHLHLSERRAPHAVEWFISKMPLDNFDWPALKAVTIEDVPRDILETLLADVSLLSEIQWLSFDANFKRYHSAEYNESNDFGIVIPILNSLPELRTLYMRIVNWPVYYDDSTSDEDYPCIDIYQNLQVLSIIECSRELLVELLNDGHLPQLRQLRIALSCKTHADMAIDPPNPSPLKQIFVPELRQVDMRVFAGVTWVLTFFQDLQQHSQLDRFNISGHVRFTVNSNFPRVAALHQWLTLTKSKVFKFQMKLSADCVRDAKEVKEDVFAEYRRATGDDSSAQYREIHIRYPEMSLSYPVVKNTSNSTNIGDCIPYEPVDENVEEMKIYVSDELSETLQAIPRWHCLKKIILKSDFADDNDGENSSHLLHIAQRSPQLRELYIESDLKYGRALSSNVQLGILLASQLEVLYLTVKEANSSLRNLVRIVDTLFGYSTVSPRLKQLTLNIDGHSTSWLSTKHLVRWLEKIFKRFPALIHFSLYCQNKEAYENSLYNLSELAPEWYLVSLLSGRGPTGTLKYRHKPYSLDIWL